MPCRSTRLPTERALLALLFAALPLAVSAQAQAQAQAPPVAADEWRYRVLPGDTLTDIASRYLSSPHDWPLLQRLNRVADPARLRPGTTLRIAQEWMSRRDAVAEVVFVHGPATLRQGAAAAAVPLAAGAALRTGDVLRTGADASATVRFSDGSRLLVVPGSEVAVEQLLEVGRARLPSVRLDLRQGDTEVQVAPGRDPLGRRFEMKTPAVNLGVRGTEFRARYDAASRRAGIEVLSGRVAAEAARASVLVDAGQGLQAEQGQTALRPFALPAAPDLSTAAERLERVPLRFGWQAVPAAAGYRAQVVAVDRPDELLLDGRFGTPAAKWADLPDGRYRLRVRALLANGAEGLDAQHAFVLKARPEPPFTTEPAQGARSRGDTARFAWARHATAARYRLQVATRPDFQDPVVDRADLTDNRHLAPLAPGDYHWRIASIVGENDQGPFGDAQSFTQRPVSAGPAPEAGPPGPAGIVLRWPAPQDGQKVRYQIASDPAFEHLVVDQTTTAAEGLLPDPAPGRYFLRAKTVDDDGFEGGYGGVQQIDVPPSRWLLLAPFVVFLLLL